MSFAAVAGLDRAENWVCSWQVSGMKVIMYS
jgi:hypothetical protein